MHYFQSTDGTGFNFNSDLSGDVKIQTDIATFEVSGKALLELVAYYLRNVKISAVESMTDAEVLGVARLPK